MAHELMKNDNMFSVKTTPWHKLGVVLENTPTIDEALKAACLDWQVRLLTLSAFQPPVSGKITRTRLPVPNWHAIQRVDTGEIFTVVSSQYKPLQNTEAFNIFRPLVESGDLTLETAGSLKNGRIVWILARVAAKDQEIAPGDTVKPYVLLSNSHNGTQAVRFGFTPIRVVCNNTLSCAHNSGQSDLIRVFHKGDLTGNLDKLREMMNVELGKFETTVEKYKALASTEISRRDMLKYIRLVFPPKKELPEAASVIIPEVDENFLDAVIEATPSLDILSRKEEAIMAVLQGGRGAVAGNKPITYWDAYNAVNEWGLYDRGHSGEGRLASAWFGGQKAVDEKALNVAVKLAAA